jgi:Uma2 family endonuclease
MSLAEPKPTVGGFSHLELPDADNKPKENTYQPLQSALLTGILTPVLDRLHPDGNYLASSDSGIYWRRTKEPLDGCRAPDWYYVANVPRLLDGEFRRSYVIWDEVISPLIVIEYVSGDGTEEHDRTPNTGKFWVYEQAIKASYYVIWDPFRSQLEVFERGRGSYYARTPDAHGRYRITEMEVDFGIWNGIYQGIPADWLRVWENGRLVPTPEEQVDLERQVAEHERRRSEAEKQRAERPAARPPGSASSASIPIRSEKFG